MKKKSLVRLLLCIVLWGFCTTVIYSQNTDTGKKDTDISEENLKINDTEDISENQEKEMKQLSFSKGTVTQGSGLFRLIIALLIVCILAYIILKFLKKAKVFKITEDPYIKVVATLKIDPSKTLYIVTIGNEAFLLGATDKTFTSLGKIENSDIINAMNLNANKSEPFEKKDFASILSRFIPGFSSTRSQDNTDNEFLSRQRNRLNKIEIDTDQIETEVTDNKAEK
ncbi:MAG: hypothetical protein CR988_05865 [Treponema sp.]|nr:MAG: hypothetical protein CR988_05865 [Treponema sp.]